MRLWIRALVELAALTLVLLATHAWLQQHPLSQFALVFQNVIGYAVDLMAYFCGVCMLAVILYMQPAVPQKTALNLVVSLPLLLLFLRPLPALLCVLLTLAAYWVHASPRLDDRQRSPLTLMLIGLFLSSLGTDFMSPLAGSPSGLLPRVYMLRQFFDRLLYWWYERGRVGKTTLSEFLFYFFGLPCMTGEAFLASYDYLRHRQRKTLDATLLRNGLATLRVWILALLGCVFCLHFAYQHQYAIGRGAYGSARVLEMKPIELLIFALLNLVFMYYRHASAKEISVAAARMLGYDVHDAYNRPLLAASPADFWRRWNIYWREFLLKIVYYPVVLAICRRWPKGRELATFLACVATFAVSSLLDTYPLAFSLDSVLRLPHSIGYYFRDMVFAVLVGTNLILEMHRVRVVKWVGLPFTLVCNALLWMGALLQLDGPSLLLMYRHLVGL